MIREKEYEKYRGTICVTAQELAEEFQGYYSFTWNISKRRETRHYVKSNPFKDIEKGFEVAFKEAEQWLEENTHIWQQPLTQ